MRTFGGDAGGEGEAGGEASGPHSLAALGGRTLTSWARTRTTGDDGEGAGDGCRRDFDVLGSLSRILARVMRDGADLGFDEVSLGAGELTRSSRTVGVLCGERDRSSLLPRCRPG